YRHVAGQWIGPSSARPTQISAIWAGNGVALAAGTGGTVIRSTGADFAPVALGTEIRDGRGVWASSATDGWVAGQAGLMVHITGGPGGAVAAGTQANLAAVSGPAADDVWAVGDGGPIVHFTSGWSLATSPTTANLSGVFARARGDAWAVGD